MTLKKAGGAGVREMSSENGGGGGEKGAGISMLVAWWVDCAGILAQ